MVTSLVLLLWVMAITPAFMPSQEKMIVAAVLYVFVQMSWAAYRWMNVSAWQDEDSIWFALTVVFPALAFIAGLVARVAVIFSWRLLKAGISKMHELRQG